MPTANPVEQSASPAPSSIASPSPEADPVTCEALVPAEAVAAYGAKENFIPLTKPVGSGDEFLELGGIQCAWGKPNTDSLNIFAWSPISPDQAAVKQAELETQGFFRQDIAEGTEYAQDLDDEWGVHFLFSDGYWIEATNSEPPFVTAPELAARAAAFL